jgi:hypothetical protein
MLVKSRFIVTLLMALAVAPRAARSSTVRRCTASEARQADEGLNHLTNWRQLYNAFKRFGHCDDGAIAEGWSAAVVNLLTT